MIPAGIVTALSAEAQALLGRHISANTVTRFHHHFVLVCGMGPQRARVGAQQLIDAGAKALISWGLAGALASHLEPGALMLPHVVLDADLREYRIDTAWRDRLHSRVQGEVKVHAGGLVLRPTVVRTTDEKRALHTRTCAAAVDMESAAIADVAHQAALPMLVIRAVADTQALSIPRFVVEASDPYGHIRVSGIVSGLLREPLALSRLLYLQRASSAALNTLRKVVQLAGPDF